MRNWIEPFCVACRLWSEQTGEPTSLIVGPLLIYSGGERDEFLDRSVESLAAWFQRLIFETGMHDHFLIFASIKLTEAGFVDWLNRLDEEHASAKLRFPHIEFAMTDIQEHRNRRQLALDVWRELALPILRGTVFGAS